MDMFGENLDDYFYYEDVSRNHPEVLSFFSQKKKKELEIFKKIKRRIGKKYGEFKRHNDVYFEVYRIQCLLFSPFLEKNMFNFLTQKLIKLEKERLSIREINEYLENFPITQDDYYMFYLNKMKYIQNFYKIEDCKFCLSTFYSGGNVEKTHCVNCAKICMNCGCNFWFCKCGDFEKCCESLKFCECENCGACENSIYCEC